MVECVFFFFSFFFQASCFAPVKKNKTGLTKRNPVQRYVCKKISGPQEPNIRARVRGYSEAADSALSTIAAMSAAVAACSIHSSFSCSRA